jgi:hypothetical protein
MEPQMFRDLTDYRVRREPPPRRPKVSLTAGQQIILAYALLFELFFLFVAPICGASIIDACLAVARSF